MDWTKASEGDIAKAIAERLEWKQCSPAIWDKPDGDCTVLPHFATSLDAMSQAEATLSGSERERYVMGLLQGPERETTTMSGETASLGWGFGNRVGGTFKTGDLFSLLSAPARTRAIAFLAATRASTDRSGA